MVRHAALAERAGTAQPFLSRIETGCREGTVETLRKVDDAPRVIIDNEVG